VFNKVFCSMKKSVATN